MRNRAALAAILCVLSWTGAAGAQTPPPAPVLEIALVARVDAPPLLDPTGQPAAGLDSGLARIESGLRTLAVAKTPVAISASPVWVSELLATDHAGTYAALLALATRRPLLAAPYAHALLPLNDKSDVSRELAEGESTLRRVLQAASQRILDPPDLALSGGVLAAARAAGIRAALAPVESTGAQPVSVGGVTLIPTLDFTNQTIDTLVNRFGSSGRVALVGRPGPPLSRAISGLSRDKRVRLVNIGDLAVRPLSRAVRFEPLDPPPASYGRAVARADAAVTALESYAVPGNATVARLRLLAGRARSTSDWKQNWALGIGRAEAVVDLVEDERSLVNAANGAVTLTSRRGAVPVTLENRARYPVRLRVSVASSKLAFPDGASRVVTVSPQGTTVSFVAEARSSGSFPMDVAVSSPDGRVRFAGGRVMVRSTAANVVALVLTLSGLLFLVGWSSRDLIRKVMHR